MWAERPLCDATHVEKIMKLFIQAWNITVFGETTNYFLNKISEITVACYDIPSKKVTSILCIFTRVYSR